MFVYVLNLCFEPKNWTFKLNLQIEFRDASLAALKTGQNWLPVGAHGLFLSSVFEWSLEEPTVLADTSASGDKVVFF